jgi:signal transduction histidine kinase
MSAHDPRAGVAESIETAIAELSNALADLDRMPVYDKSVIGFVAHAMDNYLSVSEATLDLIEGAVGTRKNSDVANWFEGLRHLGDLMQHTVGRLLSATPPEDFALKMERVDLGLLMARACDYYSASARQRHLEIVCQTLGDVPPAWADRAAVAVVADNLLSNALRQSPSPGEIHVVVAAGPGGVVCSVRDRGPGLTFLEQAQLFDGAARPGLVGVEVEAPLGHGLAISKGFVDRMGGRLWAESEPGRGSCFFFRLPYEASGTIV